MYLLFDALILLKWVTHTYRGLGPSSQGPFGDLPLLHHRHKLYFSHFFIFIKKGFWAFGVNKISSHLGYRWYQAPEISMIERYDQAVDMWSLGCVPSEELSMLQNFAKWLLTNLALCRNLPVRDPAKMANSRFLVLRIAHRANLGGYC